MKKLLAAFFISVLAAVPAHAEIIGEVLTTDIAAFIDSSPIESYNYNDYTYVVAEDLRNYGFDVEWDASARRLDISRAERSFTPFVDEFINKRKDDTPLFTHAYDIYSTDIAVYINGAPIQSFNINGKTIINTDYLGEFGDCTYNNDERRYDVDIIGREIAGCEIVTSKDDFSYRPYSESTEKGFFDNGSLTYGVKTYRQHTSHGEVLLTEKGDFSAYRTIQTVSDELENIFTQRYNYEEFSYDFAVMDSNFPYGMCLTAKCRPDGSVCGYIAENGKRYFDGLVDMDIPETTHKYGRLYKDGILVAEGKPIKDTITIFGEEYIVLHMPGYTDPDGVIYYYPDLNGGRIFYRGEVVNGVAHGSGTVFSDSAADFDAGNYTVVNAGESVSMTAPDVNVICRGDFFNGLPHGSVELFNYGELLYSGGAELGRKSGFGREYTSWNSNTRVLEYEGGFENGQRSGGGREYGMTFDGLWLKFDGNWQDGSYENGKWYDFNNETLQPELYYEGEFRYGEGEKQYGTHYKYYNEETNQYETKTGYFINWEYAGE